MSEVPLYSNPRGPARLSGQPELRIDQDYRGTSLTRKRTPLGHYRRPMPSVLGGLAVSYKRGTPVDRERPASQELSQGRSIPRQSSHQRQITRLRRQRRGLESQQLVNFEKVNGSSTLARQLEAARPL